MSAALTRARKLLRARHRRRAGVFLAEGPHVIEEALAAEFVPIEAFVGPDPTPAADLCAQRLHDHGVPLHLLDETDLREVADTTTPQGVVAILPEPPPPNQPFESPGLWLALDAVQDPGNAGTLLRAAEAFGAAGVIVRAGTVDIWSPKTVRSGQGAHFHLPIVDDDEAPLAELRRCGGEVWVADGAGESVYDTPPRPALCALVLGNEAQGVSESARAVADRAVAVPQSGRTESLNVALAGAVLLSWLCRA